MHNVLPDIPLSAAKIHTVAVLIVIVASWIAVELSLWQYPSIISVLCLSLCFDLWHFLYWFSFCILSLSSFVLQSAQCPFW